ncbi:phage/plasmid primase, P4 family [Lysinibacillus capsici]|uniref:DNA primase family protein n=1 Tax=Lysinibacillus TaxID=400634 RepID=UPI00258F8C25|nr:MULTISPECIES: phage/plasmid primase, P4 family [Lysinibacillus]WPK04633.1 phage/plasmid primase, P4 family [Lysinibacillus capsici]
MKSNIRMGFKFHQPVEVEMDGILNAIQPFNDNKTALFENNDQLYKKSTVNSIEPVIKSGDRSDKEKSLSNSQLAELFIERDHFILLSNALYIYDTIKKHYVLFQGEYSDRFMRRVIPNKYKNKINSHSIREIIQWVKASPTIEHCENIKNTQNLIAFKNVIYDFNNDYVIQHSPDSYFTSLLNVEFPDEYEIVSLNYFERFMEDITDGNENVYNRIQEVLGYIISEIRNIKCIPFLIGPKDSGKSVFLKLVEYLVGEENTSNLSLDQLNKPDYLIKIIGKRLNTCAEVPEIPLNKLDTLKKLSGGDKITVRGIFENPVEFINSAALLFAGNDLPNIKNLDKSNAFVDRLIIVPFFNKIEKHQQDITLLEKLKNEADYITLWAIEGLKRLQQNNYTFTTSSEILQIESEYITESNSIQLFLDSCCIFDPSHKIHYSELENAFIKFIHTKNLMPSTFKELHNYIKLHYPVSSKRFRLHGENKNGYYGLTVKL